MIATPARGELPREGNVVGAVHKERWWFLVDFSAPGRPAAPVAVRKVAEADEIVLSGHEKFWVILGDAKIGIFDFCGQRIMAMMSCAPWGDDVMGGGGDVMRWNLDFRKYPSGGVTREPRSGPAAFCTCEPERRPHRNAIQAALAAERYEGRRQGLTVAERARSFGDCDVPRDRSAPQARGLRGSHNRPRGDSSSAMFWMYQAEIV